MNPNYTAGRNREYRTMRLLQVAGYNVHRMAGSHSTWDVIGVNASGIVLVQVKLGCKPPGWEYELMKDYECPANAKKLVHLYSKGQHLPDIEEV